jgi:hypothetical protein
MTAHLPSARPGAAAAASSAGAHDAGISIAGVATAGPTTLALGGTRQVPVPDPVARDYLLLALRLDQHIPGLVDGYFGPADLKAQVDMEQLRPAARLRDDAASLRARLPFEVGDRRRMAWLEGQLVALETQARAVAGDPLPYLEHVDRCFDWRPERLPDGVFEAAAAEIDRLVPGTGSLDARLADWDAALTIPVDRLPGILDWLVETFRVRAARDFGLPAGEQLRVSLVTGKPWSGYNWYDGGLRSRVEINTDLPVRAPDLLRVVAHETFPGHHLEHAWKEAGLVMGERRLEYSAQLINAPECLLSEGLANLGFRFAVPPPTEPDLLVELFERAGLAPAADPARARDVAWIAAAMRPERDRLRAISANAAMLRHVDGLAREAVVDYIVTVGRTAPPRAEQSLDFIEHPLWRTYVFVYSEGEELLRRWLELVPGEAQIARFNRLLREAPTPSGIAAELAATP